jgi:hypothetical protein
VVAVDCVIALMMEAVSTSETLVNSYQTTRRIILKQSPLHFPDLSQV